MRILFKYFIQQEAVVSYLTSKKLRKGAMAHNFLSLRVIWKEILMSKPAALKRWFNYSLIQYKFTINFAF